MTIFTLCSNNYLAMAGVLGRSVLRQNPTYTFIIGLVDCLDERIDYKKFLPAQIIPVADLGIPQLKEMILKYSIIELNTAVKPFYFQYIFDQLGELSKGSHKVCYLDPDTRVYSNLVLIEQALETASVLLTPHLLHPVVADGGPFGEHIYLNYGLYNLGFCGMRWSSWSEKALAWWANHLVNECKDDVENGLFVDQLWMNYAPIFFEQVEVSRNVGLNVAYWNLQERRLARKGEVWYVNDGPELLFYHFSSFQFYEADSLGKFCTRFTMSDRAEMKALYDEYRVELNEYEFLRIKKIPCAYVVQRAEHLYKIRRDHYIKNPMRLLTDYWKRPLGLLSALARAAAKKAE